MAPAPIVFEPRKAPMTTLDDLKPGEATIVISRVFDAPRELVFQAFTDPQHLSRFWGPKWTACTVREVDPRVGGAFRIEMRGPDGAVYPCTGIYREIVPPERIVLEGTAEDDNPCGGGLPPRSRVTIAFAAQGDKTRLTIHARLQTNADRDAAIAGGFNEGWNDSLDRLAAALAGRR
jgi:uncharacterized protein YndB with AHSA1/START domain